MKDEHITSMNLLLTLNNFMSELTPQQEEQLSTEIKSAQLKAIKIMKKFANLLLKLPDEFELDQKTLDELLKPLTEEMYKEIIDDEGCQYDISSAIDLIGVILGLSLKRCDNQTKSIMSELYKLLLGHFEPENEMPIHEIVTKLRDLQTPKE